MAYKPEDKEALERFGSRMRQLRISAGLSQEQVGLECDLSQTYLSEVEAGKRNVSLLNIRRIAKSLNVTLAQLFEGLD
jgi:transcriptional regulator with XRE-family HTH domain